MLSGSAGNQSSENRSPGKGRAYANTLRVVWNPVFRQGHEEPVPSGADARPSPYASSLLPVQSCFANVSCATRLNARAATVLSRRGAVMPRAHTEQHQTVKSPPSIQIKRLCIHLPCGGFPRKADLRCASTINDRLLLLTAEPYIAAHPGDEVPARTRAEAARRTGGDVAEVASVRVARVNRR
jgi:hypothetical protein